MRLSSFTVSNPYLSPKSLFQFVEKGFFQKTQKIQERAFSTLQAFSLSKPVDRLSQRIWKVLPSVQYVIYKVIAYLFPFYGRDSFQALNLLTKMRGKPDETSFSSKEKALISQLFQNIQICPSTLQILRAFSNKEQRAMLWFIQGILGTIDAPALEKKLDGILSDEINPLTVEEIGRLELSVERQQFLKCLHRQGIQEIAPFLIFWTKMAKLKEHPVMCALRQRTMELFSGGCLGFLLSYEDDKKVRFNLQKDALLLSGILSKVYYLLVGNTCHVGFAFAKDGKIYISDMTPSGRYAIKPLDLGILYPFKYLYKFTIKPLLASSVSAEDAEILQQFFAKKLTEEATLPRKIEWGLAEGLSSFFLGMKTPFWDRKKVETMQSRELCTGCSAKMVYQAFLKTKEKLLDLGYVQDQIKSPFLPSENMGCMLVAEFIKHFSSKQMIEIIQDPFLTACIEPGFLKEELSQIFKSVI